MEITDLAMKGLNQLDSRFKLLFSNTMFFALGSIGSKFIMFFLLPLYTNALTTKQYGIIELVITGSNLIIPFISLSIQDAVLRFTLDKQNKRGEVLKNASLVLTAGAVITICISPLFSWYKPISEWSVYFVIITILQMYRTVFSLYLKAIDKTKLFAIDNIVYTFLLAIANIILLLVFKMGISGYFTAMIFATLFSLSFIALTGGILKDLSNSKINKTLLKQMVVFSTPMIMNAVSWWIANSSNRILLEHFISADAVGIYSVAAKMPSLLTSITSIFMQAWIISSVTEYDSTRDESFYEKTFIGYNYLLVVFASLIILLIKPFMQVFVGSSFIDSWKYVPYLILGSIFLTHASFFGAIYTSAKKNIGVMFTTLLGAFINIILNIVLIPYLNIQGASIATMVSYGVVGIYRMIDSRRYLKFFIDFKKVLLSLMILMVQCIFAYFNFYPMLLSLVCFIILILINLNELWMINQYGKRFITKFLHK